MRRRPRVELGILLGLLLAPAPAHGLAITDLSTSVVPNPTRDYLGEITWNAVATLTNDSATPIFVEEITWNLFEDERLQGLAYDEFVEWKWQPIPLIPELPAGASVQVSTGSVVIPRSKWIGGFEGVDDPDSGSDSGLLFKTGITVKWYPGDDYQDKHEDSELQIFPEPATLLLVATGVSLLVSRRLRRRASS